MSMLWGHGGQFSRDLDIDIEYEQKLYGKKHKYENTLYLQTPGGG